jgi:hypothetical protein
MMTDIGTRLQHLMDLQKVWSDALGILTSGTYHSKQEKDRAARLEIALGMLDHYLALGYNDLTYAQEINKLPKSAEEIKDEDDTPH